MRSGGTTTAAPPTRGSWQCIGSRIGSSGPGPRTGRRWADGDGVDPARGSRVEDRNHGGFLAAVYLFFSVVLFSWAVPLLRLMFRLLRTVGASRNPLKFREPPRWYLRALSFPFRFVNPPVLFGKAQLGILRPRTTGDDGPRVILVGNHTVLGLDHIPLLNEVKGATGVYPRNLYDTVFSYIPGWRQLAEAAGGVMGKTKNCEILMSTGKCLLLYPGGANEACKEARADKYKLMWSHEQMGFVRQAIKHGYSILPFASVGVEDSVQVALRLDISWITALADGGAGSGGNLFVPVLLPINRLERQYWAFGESIGTRQYGQDWENNNNVTEVYDAVRGEVESLICKLKAIQARDPNRCVVPRCWRRLRCFLRFLSEQEYDAVVLGGLQEVSGPTASDPAVPPTGPPPRRGGEMGEGGGKASPPPALGQRVSGAMPLPEHVKPVKATVVTMEVSGHRGGTRGALSEGDGHRHRHNR